MKKILFTFALTALIGTIGYGSTNSLTGEGLPQMGQEQKAEAIVPLEGLDPVLLVEGKEKMGSKEFSVIRGKFNYWFASAETKAKFDKEPERYEIQMGGSCPVVPSATGNPDLFLVHKGRIYIFATTGCVEDFKANPESFVKP